MEKKNRFLRKKKHQTSSNRCFDGFCANEKGAKKSNETSGFHALIYSNSESGCGIWVVSFYLLLASMGVPKSAQIYTCHFQFKSSLKITNERKLDEYIILLLHMNTWMCVFYIYIFCRIIEKYFGYYIAISFLNPIQNIMLNNTVILSVVAIAFNKYYFDY